MAGKASPSSDAHGPTLLGPCEAGLNRAIAASAAAAGRATQLDGKRLRLSVEGLGLDVDLVARSGRIELEWAQDAPPDVQLEGAPLDLLRIAAARANPLARLKETHASLTGDVRVAEAFAALLEEVRPDWEEAVSGWVGDVAAHEIGRLWRGSAAFARKSAAVFALDLAEYLQEERAVLPPPASVRAFHADVDRLRDAVERLEQRIDTVAKTRAAGR
jgi:ubiquinone biosynthesis protein UbiJ